jgi:hypothetical protein
MTLNVVSYTSIVASHQRTFVNRSFVRTVYCVNIAVIRSFDCYIGIGINILYLRLHFTFTSTPTSHHHIVYIYLCVPFGCVRIFWVNLVWVGFVNIFLWLIVIKGY